MPDYEEIIKQSQANVKSLSEKLKDLDKLHQEIKALKEAAEGIPDIFNKMFQELVKLSEDYTNTIGAATKNYLDGNNTLFTIKLSELSTKIKEFEKEITRLINTDFTKLFKDLQKVFIDQTRADIATELKRFEDKSKDLQAKIDELKNQIERLEKIDLEKHFDKLQKTLAEIFGAINAINFTLTNIVQTLTGIVQTLGSIQTSLDTNHKEAKHLLNSFSEATEKHLTDQDKQATKIVQSLGIIQTTLDKNYEEAKQLINSFSDATEQHLSGQDKQTIINMELLESKMKSLSDQNELLKKGVKTNRIIQIVGFVLVSIIFIYIIVR